MIFKSLVFITMLVGLVFFVLKFFLPTFPLDQTQILALVLFLMGLFGIVPEARVRTAMGVTAWDSFKALISSMSFWTLVAGVLAFALHYYAPTFPISESAILAMIVYILGFFQINPELKARGLL
jgi:hypothetical protein